MLVTDQRPAREVTVNDVSITDYQTSFNTNELNCGICNGVFYADQATFEGISRVMEQGRENPFVCDACRAEYEEMAVER